MLDTHGYSADVVVQRGKPVAHHAGGVGITDEERFVNVVLTGVLGFGQNGTAQLVGIQLVRVFVIILVDGSFRGG